MPRAKTEPASKALHLLTPLELKNAKLPEGKAETSLNDGGGLYLIITANRKRWCYRYGLNGKMQKQWLGDYPKITLAQARKIRNDSLNLVEAGKDPRAEKQAAKIAANISQANTFEAIALEWHAKELASGTWIPSHADRIMKRLKTDIFPIIGHRAIDSLETRDLLHPLTLVTQRGTYNLAKAYRQYITVIMRFAVQTGRIKTNPALDLQGAIPTRKAINRPALPLNKLDDLMSRLIAYNGLKTIKVATLFALLTGARSSEFRFARWNEFDLKKGIWTIPAEREAVEGIPHSTRGEKMHRERIIYLSRQTLNLINQLWTLNSRSIFVFQGRKIGSPLSENTVNKVLQTIGYDTTKDICLHGFRTMMVSSLNESNRFSREAIERHIGHEGGSGNRVEQIYKRNALYLAERQRMLQWWADYLDANSNGKYIAPEEFSNEHSNVVPLKIRNA